MSIKEKPRAFETTDGKEFSDEESAKRHQAVLDAVDLHSRATKELAAALLQSQKTADGEPFDLGYKTYFYMSFWCGEPSIGSLTVDSWYSQKFEVRDGVVRLSFPDGEKTRTFDISELYKRRSAADRAFCDELRKRIAMLKKALKQSEQ